MRVGRHPRGKGLEVTADKLSSSSPSPGLVILSRVSLRSRGGCSSGAKGPPGHQDFTGSLCGFPAGQPMGLLMAKPSVRMGSKVCVAGVTCSIRRSPVLCVPRCPHQLVAVLCSGQ